MPQTPITVDAALGALERHYGPQQVDWPVDPYEFIVWWHCGYPASDAACAKGWAALTSAIGIEPRQLLAASPAELAESLKNGGMVPELRAQRLKEIAMRVQDSLGGNLGDALDGPTGQARKVLKQFPNISDPGADRILLFAGLAPIPAVPSNNPAPLVRILHGRERENYAVNYKQAQHDLDAQLPATFDARARAYLLLKAHGQQLCKRTKPKCDRCPLQKQCAYAKRNFRGRGAATPVPGSRR